MRGTFPQRLRLRQVLVPLGCNRPSKSCCCCTCMQLETDSSSAMQEKRLTERQNNSPECWQLLTRWPLTQASQAHFSPSMIMAAAFPAV